MRKAPLMAATLSLSFFMLGGCGPKDAELKDSAGNPEPVKLVLWSWAGYPTPEEFQELFAKPVRAKYPHIELELIQGTPLNQLLAQNQSPDLIISSLLSFQDVRDVELQYDLTPLIKKYSFDLNRFETGLIKQSQVNSKDGEIYGIPYFVNFNALYYNKDIFDRLGVPYPRDGMNWDEVTDLARKVTKDDGNMKLRGLDPENINRLAWLMGLGYIDPKTEKPLIQNWKPAYDLLQTIISIPENKPEGKMTMWNANPFFKDKNVAMMISTNQFEIVKDVPDLNWDMVTYPKWKDRQDSFAVAGGRALLITKTSKHKDEAFHAIETIVSNEVQKEFNRRGQLSPLKDKSVQEEFGKLPFLKGKNVQAVFKQQPGYYAATEFDSAVSKIPFNHSMDLYNGSKDINTVIRETEEEMARVIQQKKVK